MRIEDFLGNNDINLQTDFVHSIENICLVKQTIEPFLTFNKIFLVSFSPGIYVNQLVPGPLDLVNIKLFKKMNY